MAARLEFPSTIGPFTMQPCRVHNAINAFYRQHQFPKPDPTSDGNSMAGVDPGAAGLGSGEILFCQLSPLHRITLDDETKAAANIPRASEYFAWCYPVVDDGVPIQGSSPEALFLQFGGYVYFSVSSDAIGSNCIAPAPLGTLGLMFGRAQSLLQPVVDTLTRQGRFQEVTLKPLSDKGATYFPVVSKPVFTTDLLDEELDDSETWGIVRIAIPMVERLLIFDRNKSFADNLQGNPAKDLFVQVSDDDVYVTKASSRGDGLPYDQWRTLTERATLSDPWVFNVSAERTRQIEASADLFELDPF